MIRVLGFIALLLSFNWVNSQTLTNSNLPIVIITTENGAPIVDDPRVVAHMGVIDNGPGNTNNVNDPFTNYDGRIEIEIRGSTSQQYPKKNYGFETQDALGNNLQVGLLGMPVENDWILYGPYPDKTLIRNVLTFDLAQKMGHYASNTRYCELIVNGEYRGLYIAMERIKIDNDRIDLEDIHTPNTWDDTLTGGFILKVDKLTGEVGYTWQSIMSNEVLFQFHDPEYDELNAQQAAYMESFINDFETTTAGPNFDDPVNGYQYYIAKTSFYDFFIMQELGRTVDGYRSSSFMYKEKNTLTWNAKIHAGPMWDFNLSYGNADYCDADLTTGWQYEFDNICNFTTQIPFWWARLLESPVYRNGLRCRWEELRQGPFHTDSIHYFIDSVANHIQDARIRNFQKWPIIGVYVNWNGFVGQTYQEDLDYLKTYIANRAIWLDNNIPGICDASVDEIKEDPIYHTAWPNPFNDHLSIGFTLFDSKEIDVRIYDYSGRLVLEKNQGNCSFGKNTAEFTNIDLKSGGYIYHVVSNGEIIYNGKLLKL